MSGLKIKCYGDDWAFTENLYVPAITKPEELLIRVKSCGVNPADVIGTSGYIQNISALKFPCLIGYVKFYFSGVNLQE
jgi:NADPH:quinone reductase-like Zn-dependent oxidoreductase